MEPVSERRWDIRAESGPAALVERFALELDLLPWIARLLHLRGLERVEEARTFLSSRLADLPDPSSLIDLDRAVERLVRAVRKREPILVHGDYDVDGISGASLLTDFLRRCGADCRPFVPLRMRDGYGLAGQAIRQAAVDGIKVVLSVDCGISASTEAALAAELGLDLIITDHHQPPDELPRALAIINPHRPDCRFPFKDLAGVGVAFFLVIGLRRELRRIGHFTGRVEPDLRLLLDLVALGTIADLVPLRGINRTLAKAGLFQLEQSLRPGVAALREVAKVKQVNCGAVGFRLAPRLNAAGRLEDAGQGVELLLTEDPCIARSIAEQLDDFNRQRQRIELEGYQQALERLDAAPEGKSIVLADARWHQGVIGIIASRLVERFHRPTVLIALEGEGGKGSARSIHGLHLFEALGRCQEHLLGFGGHAAAAGLSITADGINAFSEQFETVCGEMLLAEDLLPRLLVDGEIGFDEIDNCLVRELARLAPFGIGNPEPLFLARDVQAVRVSLVGKEKEHLRFIATQGGESFTCIAFGKGSLGIASGDRLDLAFNLGFNNFRGPDEIQLRIKDLRPAQDLDHGVDQSCAGA